MDPSSPYEAGATVTVLGSNGLTFSGRPFVGWNTEANGSGNHYAPGATFTMPAADVVLHAEWAATTYSVSYNGNGNTSGSAPVDASSPYPAGATVTLVANSFAKSGHSFSGWNTAANGSGTSYAPGATFTMPSANVVLFAQWTLTTYSVTYEGNGSTGGAVPTDASSPYAPGDTVTVLGNALLVRAGYAFNGWSTTANGVGTRYAAGATFTMPNAEVVLYAQWTLITYSVTYAGNGNTGGGVPTDTNSPYAPGATVTVLGNPALVRAGYNFSGWNTAPNGIGTTYAQGATFTMPSANVVLHAQWTLITYPVTYAGNGSTAGAAPTDASSPYVPGASVTVLGNGGLTRTGYTFSGWNTAANGSGTHYVQGATFTMPSANVVLHAQWTLITYSVTYAGNGSTGGGVPTDTSSPYAPGASVTVLGNSGLVRAGYSFNGWNTAANGTGTAYAQGASFTMPGANVVLHAQWTLITYPVTYASNGSTGGAVPTDVGSPYAPGASVTVLGNGSLARTGYTFGGWNTAANGTGTPYASGATFTMPSASVSLYAQWTLITYAVTYVGNGSTGGAAPTDASSPYAPGASVTVLSNAALVRAGYSFDGWNTAANGTGTAYAPGATFTMPSASVTLYAQWTLITYAVTYAGNGSTGGAAPTDASSPYVPGTSVTVLGNGSLSRSGYSFSGWNTAANGTGSSYAAGATFTMPSANVVLYAQWTLITYSVSYAGNGSTGGAAPTDTSSPYAPGSTVTVLSNAALLRAGYTFDGWNTTANGTGISYAPGATFTMPSANVVLYAQWTLITYSVTYAGNGNTGGSAPIDASSPYAPGASVAVLGNGSLTRSGFTFSGWNTAANGTGTPYAASATFTMPSANVVLYAQWTLITYSVTYAGNGSTGGAAPTDASSPYAPGDTVTAMSNGTLSRSGYTFSGWNTAANGTGTPYAASATFTMPSANVVLYAQWAIITYSVTYAGNGSTGGAAPTDASSPYAPGASVTVLGSGSLVRTGYSFAGWNTASDGSGSGYAQGATFTMPSANVTLHAMWNLEFYAVTYAGNGSTGGSVPTDGSSPYPAGATVTVLGNTGGLVRTGHLFTGWNTAAAGTGDSYSPSATFTMPAAATTLYAQWIPAYPVSYSGNGNTGGTAPVDASSPYPAGTTVTVLGAGSLVRSGYTFTGWNTAANGSGTAYAAAATFTMSGSTVVLYAQWALTTYSVTYSGNGNTGGNPPTDASSPYVPGATVTVLSNSGVLVNAGSSFGGWNTAANGSGTPYAAAATFAMPASNVTLYARWLPNHSVSFNANGGTGTMAPLTLGETLSDLLPANTFTRASYTFAGWATTATGAVTYNDRQQYTMGTANITLYAVWAASSALLANYTFDGQNANDSSSKANHGVASNVTYVSDGSGGYAASLNGTNSVIALPNNLVKNNPTFTLMIRFKATPSQYGLLFGYQNSAAGGAPTNYVPVLGVRSDGRLRGELWVGSALQVLSAGAVNDGQWHTAYFSATPGSITLYLDGVNIGTNSGTVQHLDMAFNQIGTGDANGRVYMPNPVANTNAWFYFNGLVDDFYMYSTAL